MLILQASDMHAWDRSLFLWINLDAQSPAALVSLAVVASRRLPALGVAGLVLALLLGPRRWRRGRSRHRPLAERAAQRRPAFAGPRGISAACWPPSAR